MLVRSISNAGICIWLLRCGMVAMLLFSCSPPSGGVSIGSDVKLYDAVHNSTIIATGEISYVSDPLNNAPPLIYSSTINIANMLKGNDIEDKISFAYLVGSNDAIPKKGERVCVFIRDINGGKQTLKIIPDNQANTKMILIALRECLPH